MECYHDGGEGPGNPHAESNVALFVGTSRLNHEEGYAFEARVIDRGEPGRHDEYRITAYRMSDTQVFIEMDARLSGGNIQIHPPNPSLF